MNDNLKLFLNKVFDVPLWTKLAINFKLSDEMSEFLSNETLLAAQRFAMFSPTLSFAGKKELDERKCGFDGNIYNFLKYCEQDFGLLSISVNTFLSLEEVAKCFIFCLEQGFIEKNMPDEIFILSEYISSKIRLGEYLVKSGQLTFENLNKALETQNNNTDKRLGEILLMHGFVNKCDLDIINILKDEAQKRFVLDYGILPKPEISYTTDKNMYTDEILKLKAENQRLKQKLQNLHDVVNKVIR